MLKNKKLKSLIKTLYKSRRFLKMETDLLDTDAVDIESEESIEDETT